MPVVFGATTGSNSYADGDSNYNGVCEVCHTGTKYYRNDGSGDSHPEYTIDETTGGPPGTDCAACHSHSGQFAHSGDLACGACHGQTGSHATHTAGDIPRGPAPAMACGDCHDTNDFPSFADGETSLAATTVCDGCHGSDGAAMAKANWDTGIYEADGSIQSGKEQWCVSCHANKAGDNTTYGYYVTGHGNTGTYNATRHGQNGPGYACTVCHDTAASHTSGTPEEPYRLKAVPDDGLDYTTDTTEVCLDCHKVGKTDDGWLGHDATAEATVHSGGVTGFFSTSAQAPTAFPAFGDSADYATNPGYQCEDCHDVHGTQKLAMVRPTIDGKVGGTSNPVSVAGLESTDTDLTDLDPAATADNGVCDTCHTSGDHPHPDTIHDGNHWQGETGDACMDCHAHTASFFMGAGAACDEDGCHPHTATPPSGSVVIFPDDGHYGEEYGPFQVLVDCVTCHDNNLLAIHGVDPVTLDYCSTCHPARYDTLGTWDGSCQQGDCHSDYHEDSIKAHEDFEYTWPEDDCDLCHNPGLNDVEQDNCLNCHATYGPGDNVPPVTTTNLQEGASYLGPVKIDFSITDNEKVGIGRTFYRLDGGTETAAGRSLFVGDPGDHELEFRSKDQAGNVESPPNIVDFTIVQDTTPPTTTCDAQAQYYGGGVIHLTATDDGTLGVKKTCFTLNGGPTQCGTSVNLPATSGVIDYTLLFWSEDWSGNVEDPPNIVYFTVSTGSATLRLVWGNSDTNPDDRPTGDDWADWYIYRGGYNGPLVAHGTSLHNPNWDGVDDVTVPVSPTPYYVRIEWEWEYEYGETYFPDLDVTTVGHIYRLSY